LYYTLSSILMADQISINITLDINIYARI